MENGVPQQKRRLAAKEKAIADITKDDIRVRLFGTVIEKADSCLVIDDGSGKIEITCNAQPESIGKKVRVIARILPLADGFEARAELIQNMDGFDFDLYKKVREIANSI